MIIIMKRIAAIVVVSIWGLVKRWVCTGSSITADVHRPIGIDKAQHRVLLKEIARRDSASRCKKLQWQKVGEFLSFIILTKYYFHRLLFSQSQDLP